MPSKFTLGTTGVYVSPNGSGTAELFTLLAQQPAFPADEVHLYAGDWNAHTASHMESHLMSSDNLPIRVGDEHDASPQHADLTGESITAAHRGRLLLRLLGTLGHIILNGRFEPPGSSSIPYTFERSTNTSIVDYVMIGKQHFPLVVSCTVYNLHRTRATYNNLTDHNPITLSLNLPIGDPSAPRSVPPPPSPPRLLFRSALLKDPVTATAFSESLEQSAKSLLPKLTSLKTDLESGAATAQHFADKANLLVTHAIQEAADKHLSRVPQWKNRGAPPAPANSDRAPPIGLKWAYVGTTRPSPGVELDHPPLCQALKRQREFSLLEWASFGIRNLRKNNFVRCCTSHFQPAAPTPSDAPMHASADPIQANLFRNVQAARNALSHAKKLKAPPSQISPLGLRFMAEKRALLTHKLKKAQHPLLSQASRDGPQAAENIWTLLRSYKNDHAKSTLPSRIYGNGSKDKRLWKKGPLTADPLVWHHYRSALGFHLLQHTQSPFDESAACKVIMAMPQLIASVAMPPTPTDPLFVTPLTPAEFETEIKTSPPDKAPGPDGITNRMIRAAGPEFKQVLFMLFNTIWHHDCHPEAWQKSLVQPIFKGGKKDRYCPSSYRAMILISALAKLFEGILVNRLTAFTEANNTLTDNQIVRTAKPTMRSTPSSLSSRKITI